MTSRNLVLLHAFPLDTRMWAEVAERLAVAMPDLRILVPELEPMDYESEPSLDAIADRVVHAMAGVGMVSATVAGLSLGGYVAMNLVRRHPERLEGLALVDTKASSDADAAAQGRLEFAERVESEGMGWVPAVMLPNLVHRREVHGLVGEWILEADPAWVAWVQRAMAARPDSLPALEAWTGPTMVVVGNQDRLSPWQDAEAMAVATGGELVVIPGVGHLSAVEDPESVAEALARFLQR